MLKNLIPPYDLNYNYSGEKTKYQESFSSNFQRFFLPQAIHYSNNQDIQSGAKLPKILDLGCGFANMAHALAIAKQACKPLRDEKNITDETTYVGIDIRKDAIDWLKIAYVNLIDFKFHQHEASQKADYVGNFTLDRQSESTTIGHSDGSECIYSLGYDYAADIQWSSSFFTHLTYNASLESLKFASQHLKPNGVAVNTWLIADAGSCLAMAIGAADRKCEIDLGSYLTYSADNPLVCTLYKLEAVKELYFKAGFKIIDILRGSWRGSNIQNQFNHYQDVVVAIKR